MSDISNQMKELDEELQQIRAAYYSARPNRKENISWFHSHQDIGKLLGICEQLKGLTDLWPDGGNDHPPQ